MNYVQHLNALMETVRRDPRLNPTHISIYLSLFRLWNILRFPDSFYINREEVMSVAKVGAKGTYHRCMRELNDWNYIVYMPSHNPYKGSRVRMFALKTTLVLNQGKPTTGTETDKNL